MYEDDDSVSEQSTFSSLTVGRMIPNPGHRWNKCSRTKVSILSFTIWPSYKISDGLFPPFEGTLKSFQDFLRSEFSDENVEFWLACEDYRSSSSADELQRKARSIYDKFIQPTACREVSLTHSRLVSLQERQEKPHFCVARCFTPACCLHSVIFEACCQRFAGVQPEQTNVCAFHLVFLSRSTLTIRLKKKSASLWRSRVCAALIRPRNIFIC